MECRRCKTGKVGGSGDLYLCWECWSRFYREIQEFILFFEDYIRGIPDGSEYERAEKIAAKMRDIIDFPE